MKNYIFFFCALFVSLLALTFSSCSEDEALTSETSSAITDNAELKTITFQVSTGSYSSSTRAEKDTEHGEDGSKIYEDDIYIDYSYAYIYSTDDILIGKITGLSATQSSDDTAIWTISGQTSTTLPSSFKIVFLGNYRPGVITSSTSGMMLDDFIEPEIGNSIDELWTPSEDTSSTCPRFEFVAFTQPSFNRRLPFYGVHLYNDYVIEEDEYNIVLNGQISLMRGVAKVEIYGYDAYGNPVPDGYVSEHFGTSTSFYTCHFNQYGYPTPQKVYTQYDYDNPQPNICFNTSSQWTKMTEFPIELYLFEQDNHVESGKYVYMNAPYHLNASSSVKYLYFYFADYKNGTTTAYDDDSAENMAMRWDICRNHLYRFYVTFYDEDSPRISSYDIDLATPDWEKHFENNSTTILK